MAETKKLTKKDYFSKIRGIVENDPELVAFIDHELELLNRKNSSKGQTKNQIANEAIMDEIVTALISVGEPVTISEFQARVPEMAQYTNQKLSALFKKLVESERVAKSTNKKKTYFSALVD